MADRGWRLGMGGTDRCCLKVVMECSLVALRGSSDRRYGVEGAETHEVVVVVWIGGWAGTGGLSSAGVAHTTFVDGVAGVGKGHCEGDEDRDSGEEHSCLWSS